MKRIGLFVGWVVFWVGYPVLWVYLRRSSRTRVLIVCDDEFLAVRGWLGSNDWSLPGGGLHKGENAVQGLVREAAEETGIELDEKDVKFLFHDTHEEKGIRFDYDCFVVTYDEKPDVKIQKKEIADYKWLKAHNPEHKLAKDARHILSQWQKTA